MYVQQTTIAETIRKDGQGEGINTHTHAYSFVSNQVPTYEITVSTWCDLSTFINKVLGKKKCVHINACVCVFVLYFMPYYDDKFETL